MNQAFKWTAIATAAFSAGQLAACEGKTLDDCPFPIQTDEAAAWRSGCDIDSLHMPNGKRLKFVDPDQLTRELDHGRVTGSAVDDEIRRLVRDVVL